MDKTDLAKQKTTSKQELLLVVLIGLIVVGFVAAVLLAIYIAQLT